MTEMNELFCNMDIRIKSGESLLHWEELFSSREENIANYDKRELENLKSFSKKAFLKQVCIHKNLFKNIFFILQNISIFLFFQKS